MDQETINALIRRYETVSFNVMKKAESLIKDEIVEELTYEQHMTLHFIKSVESCTATTLSEAFFVKKSAITAIVNRLTEKGLITRTRDPKDRRQVYLTLSEKGQTLYKRCETNIHQLVRSMILNFESEEIKTFIETYEKLSHVLDHMIEQSKEVSS